MKKRRDLPPRVFASGAWHYLVTAEGTRRVWTKLSKVSEGLPAVYRELANLMAQDVAEDRLPAVVARWERDVMPRHASKTQADEFRMGRVVADSFAEFTVDKVGPPQVAEFLRPLRAKPRTHNGYRAYIRELMRFAIELGLRPPGSNPVTDVPTMTLKSRTRYISDSELRRIKVAANYGDDGLRTRSGLMLCALVDMAYLTGQRIGDLLALEWDQIKDGGILFVPKKTEKNTGVGADRVDPKVGQPYRAPESFAQRASGFRPPTVHDASGLGLHLLGCFIGMETCREACWRGRRAFSRSTGQSTDRCRCRSRNGRSSHDGGAHNRNANGRLCAPQEGQKDRCDAVTVSRTLPR